jgi:outer membrane protein OmpA-like peptidoglycan-associated protein
MNALKHAFRTMLFALLAISSSAGQAVVQDMKVTSMATLNTPAIEFSPVFYHHGLVYVSSQYRHGRKDNNINENTFELLYADLGPKGLLSKPAPLSLEVNTKFHEGPVSFSEDMQQMFFSRSNLVNGKPVKDANGKIQMKIYQASHGKTDWEGITALPFNNDEYTCMHPSLSKDGTRLYFASDRPGGYGGMDLYLSEWKNNSWGTPVNLGPEINTNRSEAFPYIHPSGKLFFSSNRIGTIGGLDIFMVDIRDAKVGKVVSLPTPINSFQDDLGFMISNSGTVAFLSSDRVKGKGKDDIYRIDIPGGLNGLFPPKEEDLLVSVKNRKTKESIGAASIKVIELKEGESMYALKEDFGYTLVNINNEVIVRYFVKSDFSNLKNVSITDDNGLKKITVLEGKKYIVVGAKEGFLPNFITFKTFRKGINTVELLLDPIDEVITATPEVVEIKVGTVIILDQIYYDFDKSYIRTDASRGLDAIFSLMSNYPGMEIDLIAHTDSRGDKKYNQRLSDLRASSAKYYLTSRGIADNRITTIGKGESNPRNGCKDGVKCSETEHQYNRRTEIKVVSLGDSSDKIEYQNSVPDYINGPGKRKKN